MRERRQARERRVRQRLLAALLGCAVTVLAAAAPGVALAVSGLSHAQDRATGAALDARATVLSHALADERDDLAVLAAGGRSTTTGTGLTASDRARVDRQVQDVSAGAPAALRATLATLPGVRTTALAGKGGPQGVITAYQPLTDALGRVAGPVTAPLGRAVAAASVQRGLLVGALTGSGAQHPLVAAAQVAHVQEQAALAEFRATAPADLVRRYDQTVTGADSAQADRDLATLLDEPQLSGADRALGTARVRAALTARIGLMRSVEASFAADEAHTAAADRDHDVTVLELRAALAALCLALTIGLLVTVFRSVTRPLAALHRWSRADAESGQGVEVIGADEFAAVARRANALTHEAQAVRARACDLAADRTRQLGVHSALSAERDALLRRQDDLTGQLGDVRLQGAAQVTYVNLSLRTLGLVERQLTLIEGLEDNEQDPDRLETLFKLDHLATRMRRNSENLLVLTGTEHSHGAAVRPVPLLDVARAAISEIERYERVRVQALPTARVAGRAADDISHLVAELLDNAGAFSAPTAEVHLSGWLLESGEVMLTVEDSGIGVPPERLDALNALLAEPDPAPPGSVSGMGLYVVARLAQRHGVRVQLRPQKLGGTAAVVVLPRVLLPAARPEDGPATPVEAALAGEPAQSPAAQSPAAQSPAAQSPAAPPAAAPDPEPAAVEEPVEEPVADLPAQREHDRPAPDGDVPYPAAARRRHGKPAAEPAAVEEPSPEPAPEPAPGRQPAPEHGPPAAGAPLTAKGLPQRTPRGAGVTGEPAVRGPQRGTPVDAEDLRRKLGGLQRGLHAGRRDVAREVGGGAPHQEDTGSQVREGEQGDSGPAETVEEATR